MDQTRRRFLRSAAAAGSVTLLPLRVGAESHTADMFETPGGTVTVHPIDHASLILETPVGAIYVDPVGEPQSYNGLPLADLVLVTHEHGDHYNAGILADLAGTAPIMTNRAVFDMLPAPIKGQAIALANGESGMFGGMEIEAIPAYNTTEGRTAYHPQGRDNGYVISLDGFRIYVSGDTEDVPEMRALENIDLAFVCMNLPWTMDAVAAADAVAAFKPTYVYPYHYRGRNGGTQDPRDFAARVGDRAEVKFAPWYGDEIMPG